MSSATKKQSTAPAVKKHSQLTPWKPGQSGNPAGRPKGARNKLGEAFLEAMASDFEVNGQEAIERVREERPQDYLKIIASILPRQAEIKIDNYEHLNDVQLRAALSSAIRDLAALGVDIGLGPGADGGATIEGEPARLVSTVPEAN